MKKFTKVIMSGAAVAAIGASMAFGLVGCGGGDDELTVSIEGSTSMEDVMLALTDAFEKKYEAENEGVDITFDTAFTGSGSGVQAATDGRVDIGLASRALSTEEAKNLESKTLCLDGISVVVNPACTLTTVTKTQLINIYTKGTAIEAEGAKIDGAFRRESGSGTRDGFQEKVGIEDKDIYQGTGFNEYNSTGSLKSAIVADEAGTKLGYISMGSVDKTVKALKYDAEDGKGAVEATKENVLSGDYALSRPFTICYKEYDSLSALAKEFIDFIMSEEGQEICEDEGCISEVLHNAK